MLGAIFSTACTLEEVDTGRACDEVGRVLLHGLHRGLAAEESRACPAWACGRVIHLHAACSASIGRPGSVWDRGRVLQHCHQQQCWQQIGRPASDPVSVHVD